MLLERQGEEVVLDEDRNKLDAYMQLKHTNESEDDPIVLWTKNCHLYPKMSLIAQEVLSIPASSTLIERVFSVAGYSSSGKRNRISGVTLETETLLKTNKHFM